MTALHDFLDTAHDDPDSHAERGGVEDHTSPDTQGFCDSQKRLGGRGTSSPQPMTALDASKPTVAAPNFPNAQILCDSQIAPGVGGQTTEPAQRSADSQDPSGGFGPNVPPPLIPNAESPSTPRGGGPILRDPTLCMCADVVDDLERVKIANQNRLRTLTMDGEHGHGLSIDHPDIKRLAALVKALEDAEHQATLNLARVMRHHPLGVFVKAGKGVGEKQAARLLASIGDPYWNDLHNRPRRLRELYAFCGMSVVGTSAQSVTGSHAHSGAGVAPTKVRGERVSWSPDARMRLWLIASKCVMVGHGGPYRAKYDEGREKYADAIHSQECKRCGPKGKPALAGSPLSAAHQHARAIRLVAKLILSDLWSAAKTIHDSEGGQ